MKLLGVDYGRRRIGLAAADTETSFVQGLTTLDRRKNASPAETIARMATQNGAEIIVIGLALDNDEQDTTMSLEARSFGKEIKSAATCPVEFVDESFSSVQADRLMLYRSRSFRRDKGNRDRIAACLILENYLKEHA